MARMTQFNTGGSPAIEDDQPKFATKPRVGSALQAKMAFLERTISQGAMATPGSASTPKPVMRTLVEASRTEDVEPSFPKPSALRWKPPETPGNSEPSATPFPPRLPVIKPPVNATFNKANVFLAPGNPPWMKERETQSTAGDPNLPDFPKPKLPGFPKPPDAPKPNLPEVPKPKLPGIPKLPDNKTQTPNNAKVFPAPGNPPWMKEHQTQSTAGSPNLPDVPKPKLPGIPKLPDAPKPNLPDVPKPKLPGVPKLPDAPKPQLPDAPKPKTPTTSPPQVFHFAQTQKPSLMSINTSMPPPPPFHPQNSFTKREGVTGSVAVLKEGLRTLNPSNFAIPKPPTTQKPSGTPEEHFSLMESTDPSLPKKKPLPNKFALGNSPQKPNRPPDVDLQRFQKNGVSLNDGPWHTTGSLQTKAFNDVRSLAMSPQPQVEEDEWSSDDDNYDDIEEVINPTPSLPSREHLLQQNEEEFIDEEMYEDLDSKWPVLKPIETNDSEEIKKKDKKQLQEEKKAKKKFKIKDPVLVIFEAKVRLDCKKGKTELALKKGETIEIIRVTDNPEGRWLARNTEGCYGYVKTDSIDIDKDRLKQQHSSKPVLSTNSDQDQEIYDDIGAQSDVSSDVQGQNGEDDDEDDYIVVVEDDCFPPPPPADEDDVYDDVGTEDFQPPPPPLGSFPQPITKETIEVMDPKKKKKFDTEEKAFRKKFKFEGEIQVLYSVTIATTLTTKKWGNKDLPLTPEEVIDVIQDVADGKLIGRNREGKFGYVAQANVAQPDDDDIYDDIGEAEECIYDN